jgi:hypothetical protein
MTSATRKYSARSPRIAKTFELYTMNGSWVTAKIAGVQVDDSDRGSVEQIDRRVRRLDHLPRMRRRIDTEHYVLADQ